MQDYYAARANEYDQVYLKPERQADLRKIERWLPEVLSGRTVLEVACGTGYWTQFIAQRSASVVAVDSSRETLRVAQTRVPQDKVRLLAGDAYSLPVPSATFDAGFAGFWWSHIPRSRTTEFLRGFHAALVPGAKVVLLDNRSFRAAARPSPRATPTATRTSRARCRTAPFTASSRTSLPARNSSIRADSHRRCSR